MLCVVEREFVDHETQIQREVAQPESATRRHCWYGIPPMLVYTTYTLPMLALTAGGISALVFSLLDNDVYSR
jgi:hypothetical protein